MHLRQTYTGLSRPRNLVFALIILVIVSGCLAMGSEEESRYAGFESIEQRIQALSRVDLHVVEGSAPSGLPVVFIHGTPGSADFFASYLLHPDLQDLRLLAIDRPGWGTSLVKDEFDGSLASQSAMVGEFLY